MRTVKVTDHLGNEYNSIKEMCEYYGITDDVYRTRMRRKWTLERILTTPTKTKDHLGNVFNSIAEMCEAYGIIRTTYFKRIKQGWTVEEALTTPLKQDTLKVKDAYGNEFANAKKMYEFYGITKPTFNNRLKSGFTLQEALTNFNDLFGYKIITKSNINGYYCMINIQTDKKIMSSIDNIIKIYRKNNCLEDSSILDIYKHYYKNNK